MNKCILKILFIVTLSSYSQIAKHNSFPTMKPHHILDAKLDNISFAFSMRVLESDYEGPLIRLRRAGDNAEQDFGWGDNDIVDIAAINTWRGTNNVYVHTWYDQSGIGRNAVQTTTHRQPRFIPNASFPYFQGDGKDDSDITDQGDHLTIVTPNGIQDLITSGSQGTIINIMRATRRQQNSFGVMESSANRWLSHANWDDVFLYFDPGACCTNANRRFNNNANVNRWEIYSFIKTATNSIARSGGGQEYDVSFPGANCTTTNNFAIGWATGINPHLHATTGFNEFIMYNTNISIPQVQEIEQNAITFWGI